MAKAARLVLVGGLARKEDDVSQACSAWDSLHAQRTIYVDDDGSPTGSGAITDPLDSIQAAIVASSDGDVVAVQPGTYFEKLRFLGKEVTVRSLQGPSVRIIDPPKGRGVTFVDGETWSSVLDGFTIRDGSARVGGGIYCDLSGPVVRGCVIRGNVAREEGGRGRLREFLCPARGLPDRGQHCTRRRGRRHAHPVPIRPERREESHRQQPCDLQHGRHRRRRVPPERFREFGRLRRGREHRGWSRKERRRWDHGQQVSHGHVRMDIGWDEVNPTTFEVIGVPEPGESLSLRTSTPAGQVFQHLMALQETVHVILPYGNLMLGGPLSFIGSGAVPGATDLAIPADPALVGMELHFQSLARSVDGSIGAFSRRVSLTIR